jgi:integrase
MENQNPEAKITLENLSDEQLHALRKELTAKIKTKQVNKGVYRPKEISTRYFNPDEWEEFIYLTSNNLRFYYWFLMLTGMRYKEARNVKWNNIDISNKQLIVTNPKGGKVMRYVQLSSYTIKLLKQYKQDNNISDEDTFKFPTIQHLIQTMKRILKNKKISYWQDYSVHNLRKTHENYLMALSLDNSRVTMHMGHNQKTAVGHYLSSSFIKDKKQLDKIRLWLGDIFG